MQLYSPFGNEILKNVVAGFLLSLTHVIIEKVLFWGQISEMDILMDLHVILNLKITFLAFGLCACMCVCVSVTSIIQKQITAETSHLT